MGGNYGFVCPETKTIYLNSEYSEPLKTAAAPNAFEAYYEEHYETIVREHALSTLSTL